MERLGDSDRVRDMFPDEGDLLYDTHPASLALYERALFSLPQGVPSGVCALHPFPIAIERGEGAYVWDIDGNRYVDYHNGFGTSVFGHANPQVTEAIVKRAQAGTHFGAMSDEAERWADHICGRYGLEWVRFNNSGTEATMDAIRLARARTGRTRILKIEGGYHGSHETALVATNMPLDGSEGPDDAPAARFFSEGLSPRLADEVTPIPFNNLAVAERELAKSDVACLIIEPILFNVGAIFPAKGYLEGLREICSAHGTLLIFDETKTGATVAHGGAEELFGVTPDIKTLGKGIGGGLPVGALGDTSGELRELIDDWKVPHLGTFSGNPLTAAAGLAGLETLSPERYVGLDAHFGYLKQGLEQVIADYELPAYVVGCGGKGCIVWAEKPQLVDFRDYRRRFDTRVAFLAWLYLVNRGVFLAPGHDEQWTHSIAHTNSEADLFVAVFRDLASALRR